MMETRLRRRQRLIFLLLSLLLLGTIVVGIGLGPASLSYDRLLPTLLGQGSFKEDFVLFSLRLPRIVITLLAGMALALSGSILQGITRNELADPGIIGINTGAGVAVAIFFLYFPVDVGSFIYGLPVAAFLGALVTAVAIYCTLIRSESRPTTDPIDFDRCRFLDGLVRHHGHSDFFNQTRKGRLYRQVAGR